MTNIDKFSLYSGILGFIVDGIALFGFILGLFPQEEIIAPSWLIFLVLFLTGIVLLYTWLAFSLFLASKYFQNLSRHKDWSNPDIPTYSFILVPLIVIMPLIVGWSLLFLKFSGLELWLFAVLALIVFIICTLLINYVLKFCIEQFWEPEVIGNSPIGLLERALMHDREVRARRRD